MQAKPSEKNAIHRGKWIFDAQGPQGLRYVEDAALVVSANGEIQAVGRFSDLKKAHPALPLIDHGADSVLTPGFVDSHVHAPQYEMIGSCGHELLHWLETYTFPTEARYADPEYAMRKWREFCRALARSGTTSAAVYGTSHTQATALLIEAANEVGIRAQIGKVLMDRNAPADLIQAAEPALLELETLLARARPTDRVKPSITVRFAPTSTEELLRGAGFLARKFPQAAIQTHLSETPEEIAWVKTLFPGHAHYADVYDRHGLLTERALLAHGIYLENAEVDLIKKRESHLVHCPSSNFFLGSGLFPYRKLQARGLSIALGSDVGAGWNLSMQSVSRVGYGAQALQKTFLSPGELLYLGTRAGAIALGEGAHLGLIEPGYVADFVVHDLGLKEGVRERLKRCESPEEIVSILLFLGGPGTLRATYVQGDCVYRRGGGSAPS